MKGHLRLLSGRRLISPKGFSARPTAAIVREAVMNILGTRINQCNWLDLFSGSGIMGCEAIERGANLVLAIEIDKGNYRTCKENLSKTLKATSNEARLKVINCEANKFLKIGTKANMFDPIKSDPTKNFFDFVFIDPPYQSNIYYSVLENLLKGNWVSNQSIAICELSSDVEFEIPFNWTIKTHKKYGKTQLFFLTPNLASRYLVDIGSMQPQTTLK